MPAYIDTSIKDFLNTSTGELLANLHQAYANDGFSKQYTTQSIAWEISIDLIKHELRQNLDLNDISDWRILLELPLYRLRKRIDLVIAGNKFVAIVEIKIGSEVFLSTDKAQAQEYALDLRDFHEYSSDIPLIPVLWCTEATEQSLQKINIDSGVLDPVIRIGKGQFKNLIATLVTSSTDAAIKVKSNWGQGAYKPVPSVIVAATAIFSGHGVEEITRSDAVNLQEASANIVNLIEEAKLSKQRYLIFLTGVPGSGKTLAGLNVVHQTDQIEGRKSGDVVYLSGNTPLVTVLREALTEDEHARLKREKTTIKKSDIRSRVRTRIQHIMGFLEEYLKTSPTKPPHERAIIFDEAQRAWDAKFGKQKFNRSASEPALLLEIMGRHDGWSVIVGLIGGGQEINTGENGMAEWGNALRSLSKEKKAEWTIFGPKGMGKGINATAHLGLGDISDFKIHESGSLTLDVPLRSFRSPRLNDWVSAVLDHDSNLAAKIKLEMKKFPLLLTRSSETAISWLRESSLGQRRYGLLSSSTNVRLRAYGFGVSLSANDGKNIADWYLKSKTDIRSSFSLEVTANEYTTQGLEIDFVGLCWGGDFLSSKQNNLWKTSRFSGTSWNIANGDRRRFIVNSYRVLMTRAREGMIIWVPKGDANDSTREIKSLDATAEFLESCGAELI
jgi:DUF2075 family protein